MSMKRRRRDSVSVYVDVEVDEVLSELSKEQLLEALAEHGVSENDASGVSFSDVERAYDAARRADWDEALLILERLCRPKFASMAMAEAALAKARGQTAEGI